MTPQTLRRTTARVLAATLLLVGVPVAVGMQAPPAHAASGYCPDDSGVTVVVDFGALGGGTSVRCAPGPVGTGLQSLQRAGFSTEGTRKDGPGFVCRIAGRPSASDVLSVNGSEYREQCVVTPPEEAYWHYFHAPNGGSWTYSRLGAANRTAIAGGFEGWAFASGAPGVAPVRPAAPALEPPPAPGAAAPPPAAAAAPPAPAAPGATKPRAGTGARTGTPSAAQPDPAAPVDLAADAVAGATPAPAPTDAADASSPPTATSRGTGPPGPTATDDVAVTAAESQAEEASVATALGVGVLAFFTAAAGTTALRRRRQR